MFDDSFPFMMERESGAPESVPPVAVSFGMLPHQDDAKSAEAGHPVYIDREFVKIMVPGDKQSLFFQPATDTHRKRFPRAYEAFQKRATDPVEGMPLKDWAPMTRGLAMTIYAASGGTISTVEALAAIHDGHIEKLGFNAREWREKAKAFLAQAKDTAAAQKLASENQKQADMIAELQRQVVELANRLTASEGKGEPKRKVA